MKKHHLFIIVFILTFIACKPNPESDYILSKETETLNERITAAAIDQQQDEFFVPANWKETIQTNHFLCNIDAEIQKPISDTLPVWQIESTKIDLSFVKLFIDAYASPISQMYLTTIKRKDLEEQLEAALRGAVMVNENDGTIYYEPFDGQEEMINDIAEQLRFFDEQIVSDPLNMIESHLPNQFSIETKVGGEWFFMVQDQLFCAKTFGDNELLQPESWIEAGDAIPGERRGTHIEGVHISENEAIAAAIDILSQLSLSNLGIVSVEKARTINAFSYETTSKGWLINLGRNDNNSKPVDFLSYSFVEALVLEDDRYSTPWFNESLAIYITDDGLEMLEWKNPKKITAELNKNIELLPFSEIQESVKKLIASGTKWTAETSFQTELNVFKIFMTYGAIRPKNTNEYRYLLPVWIVEYVYNRSPGEVCFFAINAVDGTRAELITTKMAVPK